MDRRRRLIVTCGLVAALVAPVALDRDGFPFSTYPMYARTRSEVISFVTARAVGPSGDVADLSLEIIGASDDPLVVAGELRAAIRAGRADDRCADIARRARRDGRYTDAVIEIVTERRNVIDHLDDEDGLLERDVHARCEVGST